MTQDLDLTVVIPVFNEKGSLRQLVDRLLPVLSEFGATEIIFVNDGSTDGSERTLEELHKEHKDLIKLIHLRSNFGKSNALQAGFNEARGRLVAMMDADLQDAPEELPKLVAHLESEGLDVVTGWKTNRQDPTSKLVQSRFFNKVVSKLYDLDIHDFNCGLKLMKRECLGGVVLFGQLHRFMLVFLASHGFKLGEVPITHYPRVFGHSKYGHKRIYEGVMDLLAVLYLTRFSQSPLYFFGFWGLACLVFAMLFGGLFIGLHIASLMTDFPQGSLVEHPIWILSPITGLVGVIFLFFGLLAEMSYFLAQPRDKSALVKRRVGFEEDGR